MRIQILSDLPFDVAPPRPNAVAADVGAVIVVGDTCEGAENGFAVLRRIVPMQIPIIMVMGNAAGMTATADRADDRAQQIALTSDRSHDQNRSGFVTAPVLPPTGEET